ncbi:MAG: hypothetical protein EAY75_17515 [Bacteroidetes bacterium]|nr:MAG: hypothetical protein EAY75_17515 [Bacteroidota bacterium]
MANFCLQASPPKAQAATYNLANLGGNYLSTLNPLRSTLQYYLRHHPNKTNANAPCCTIPAPLC